MSSSADKQARAQRATESREELEQRRRERKAAREASIKAAPYAVVHVESSGIHPSTSRMVSLSVLLLDPDGEVTETFYQEFNPGEDIGPAHLHGLTPEQVAEAPEFEKFLRVACRLLDGRTLITHNMPRTWGFVYAESKAALRAMHKRSRARTRNRRSRQRSGRPPRPELLIDTLATARRLGVPLGDTRVRAVARELGIDAPTPQASAERALVPAQDFSLETAELIRRVFLAEKARASEAAPLATYDPNLLTADRFGLQRSIPRVEATEATCEYANPGTYVPGTPLKQGMEFVVSPDIEMDPDTLISQAVAAGLSYAEKVTRQSSLVVCNETAVLRGKAMHAERKDIPLVRDDVFTELLESVLPSEKIETPAPTHTTHVPAPKLPAKRTPVTTKRTPRRRRGRPRKPIAKAGTSRAAD